MQYVHITCQISPLNVVRGHHCWLDPPLRSIEAALQSYAAAKQHDPRNTSMCILAPVMRKASWWKQMRKMQKITLYPKGAEILFSGVDIPSRMQVLYRLAIFYDSPSLPATLSAVGNRTGMQHHMSFTTVISGKKAKDSLDTRASQNFISRSLCEQAEVNSVTDQIRSVTTPTPPMVRITGEIDIPTRRLCQVIF